tara:strand:+ start:273 stop:1814 length:1542 start_codon:yes stop_codon:yes gene_type:complete
MISKQEFEKKIYILTNKLQVGLFNEVISGVKKLLKVSKDQILINILSLAYQGKGNYDDSIELLKNELKSNPKNIFFLNNIGLSYFKKRELKIAEYYYKKAIAINPNYINTLNNYGNLKKELNQFDEAIKYFEKALFIKNDNIEINYNLSTIYQGLGDFKNSIKYLEKISSINSNFTKADRNISTMTIYTEDNKHFISMKKKILNNDLKVFQKIDLHFALGKAYEDIEDYKNAFENIEKANSFMKTLSKYKIKEDENLFKTIKKKFDKETLIQTKHNKIKTIFILGMPRSGTSLVEQIITSHHQVFGGGELPYMNQIVDEKFLNDSTNIDGLQKIYDDAQNDYISKISFQNNNLLNFTDKSPLNFRWIGFILNMLPNSKIIHCKRNSLDVCWSNYKNQFEGGLYFTNSLVDISKFYQLYTDLMEFWEKKFKQQIYNLNYEELIKDPEKTIRDIINFCELEWDDNCLKHHKNKRPIKTVSFNQARKPIYNNKIKNTSLYDEYLLELKNSLLNRNY